MVRQVEEKDLEVKILEIRDRATFIPAIAIKLDPITEGDRYLLSRAGFGTTEEEQGEYILLAMLNGERMSYDPHSWGGATTMPTAHGWLLDSWEDIKSGDVLDVEYITGITNTPKLSERETAHLGWDSMG